MLNAIGKLSCSGSRPTPEIYLVAVFVGVVVQNNKVAAFERAVYENEYTAYLHRLHSCTKLHSKFTV